MSDLFNSKRDSIKKRCTLAIIVLSSNADFYITSFCRLHETSNSNSRPLRPSARSNIEHLCKTLPIAVLLQFFLAIRFIQFFIWCFFSVHAYIHAYMRVFFRTCSRCLNLLLYGCIRFNNVLKEIRPLSQAQNTAAVCVSVYISRSLENQYKKAIL